MICTENRNCWNCQRIEIVTFDLCRSRIYPNSYKSDRMLWIDSVTFDKIQELLENVNN